jgi:hypothetical protein
MLSKLLKYEFKDTARTIPLLYLVGLIFAGLVLFSVKLLHIQWFQFTTSVVLMLLGIAVSIITFVIIVMRFYKNLYSNEGYLMFTLPVKPGLLLASKSIAAFFWMILSYCFTAGAFLVSLYGFGVTGELALAMDEIKSLGAEKMIYLFIPAIVLATLYLLGQIYFAVTVANTPTLHSMGIAAAFLVFIATNIILQIVEAIFTVFIPFSIEIGFEKINASLTSKNMFGFILETVKGSEPTGIVIGLGGYVFEIVMVCVLFYVTSRMMKNKVSLK